MPIRLVVAVAIGAAALALLLPMAETVERESTAELTSDPTPQQVVLTNSTTGSSETVTIAVRTVEGDAVREATVLVRGDTVSAVGGPHRFETGPDSNTVEISVGTAETADVPVTFRPTQRRGTLRLDIVGPPGMEATDSEENPGITIRRPR